MECFFCGKKITGKPKEAYTQDDNQSLQFVGPNCYKQIVKSGNAGLSQGNKTGYIKLFSTREQAKEYEQRTN